MCVVLCPLHGAVSLQRMWHKAKEGEAGDGGRRGEEEQDEDGEGEAEEDAPAAAAGLLGAWVRAVALGRHAGGLGHGCSAWRLARARCARRCRALAHHRGAFLLMYVLEPKPPPAPNISIQSRQIQAYSRRGDWLHGRAVDVKFAISLHCAFVILTEQPAGFY